MNMYVNVKAGYFKNSGDDMLYITQNYDGTTCIGFVETIKAMVGDWDDDNSDYNSDAIYFRPFSTGYTLKEYKEALERKDYILYNKDDETAEFMSHDELVKRLGFDPNVEWEDEESPYSAIALEEIAFVIPKFTYANDIAYIFDDMPSGVAESYNTGW